MRDPQELCHLIFYANMNKSMQIDASQKQLTPEKCYAINVLNKYDKLVDGPLGVYPCQKVQINQIQGSELIHT